MVDEDIHQDEAPERRRRVSGWLIVGIIAAVIAGLLLARTSWEGRWTSDIPENAIVTAAAPDAEAWCSAQSTYDAIRSELFRRAAQVRGSDEQAYRRLADFALLRMSGPIVRSVDEDLRSVTCSARAGLDLPPGVRTSSRQRSLSGELDYLVQPAADGSGNVVRLGNADSIVVPLATLARMAAPQTAPLVPPELGEQSQPEGPPPEPGPEPQLSPREPIAANPSFDCDKARTRGEIAVCNDPGLAGLDRQMAAQYNSALRQANRQQRSLLQRTRNRFIAFRDRCGTSQCIAEAYRGRMREISDIMADRWRG
ncbi:MAG TPA: hypothetical protein VMK31_03590 [Sphingomicrobium sp.]|nr:hypothetical protein [Sphingomicrobium sp.]